MGISFELGEPAIQICDETLLHGRKRTTVWGSAPTHVLDFGAGRALPRGRTAIKLAVRAKYHASPLAIMRRFLAARRARPPASFRRRRVRAAAPTR